MKKIFLLAVILSAVYSPVSAVEIPADSVSNRPKIGLVLSGGGAKGTAHVAVLKVLEEEGIPIDYIAGTSMGAVIGGLYALGYSADDLDTLIRSQNWNMLMQDNMGRRATLFEDKKNDERLVVRIPFYNRKELEVSDEDDNFDLRTGERKTGGIKGILDNIPTGIVEGQILHSLFSQLSIGYQDDVDFSTFPIPFACVAVDLNAQEEIVFDKGDIVTAMRASMSIPGYFTPIKMGDRLLVDGGIVNNLPVDVAKGMGADIVISVDLHKYDNAKVNTVENMKDMFGSILMVANGRKYEDALEASDIVISPNTGAYSALSFDTESIDALLDSGRVAAKLKVDELRNLKKRVNNETLVRHNVRAVNLTRDTVFVSQISISGVNPKERDILMKNFRVKPMTSIHGSQLDTAIAAFYSTKAFSKITYSFIKDPVDSTYNLKINFVPERSHQAGFGFRFDSENMAAIFLSVNFNKHRLYGWKFDVSGKLGTHPYAHAQVGYAFSHHWQLNTSYDFRYSRIDSYEDGLRTYSTNMTDHCVNVFMQLKRRNMEMKLGVRGESLMHSTYLEETDPEYEKKYRHQLLHGFVSYEFDDRDKSYFATRGCNVYVRGSYAFAGSVNHDIFSNRFADIMVKAIGYVPLGEKVEFIPQFYGRGVADAKMSESTVLYSDNLIGGYEEGRYIDTQLPFVGMNFAAWVLDYVGIARTDFRFNIFGKHYVTAMANYMRSWDDFKGVYDKNYAMVFYGFGLNYSIQTIIGPIGLTGHWSNANKSFGLYFSLGYSFGRI